MNRRIFTLALVGGALAAGCWGASPGITGAKKKRVLVITHAAGFKHSSRPVAAQTVKMLGEKTGAWEVIAVADNQEQVNQHVNAGALKNLDLVFFANTTGDLGLT